MQNCVTHGDTASPGMLCILVAIEELLQSRCKPGADR